MVKAENIDRVGRQYNKVSLWIIAALTLIGLFVIQLTGKMSLINSLLLSAVYSLITCWIYGKTWKNVARKSPNVLTRFYMAASALRMILAFVVVLLMIVILRNDIPTMEGYVCVFAAFYILMLIFDSVYFARIEKSENK